MKALLAMADANEIFYALDPEDEFADKIGVDGKNLLSDTPPTFTRDEAERIYDAVVDKRDAVKSGFYGDDSDAREWRRHLDDILDEIGPKGVNLL